MKFDHKMRRLNDSLGIDEKRWGLLDKVCRKGIKMRKDQKFECASEMYEWVYKQFKPDSSEEHFAMGLEISRHNGTEDLRDVLKPLVKALKMAGIMMEGDIPELLKDDSEDEVDKLEEELVKSKIKSKKKERVVN